MTVTNSGVGSTSGSVTVTDNVPIGLVPTSAAGAGWTCNIAAQAVICNRSDPLAPGQSYPAITLAVSVQPDAPASVTNTAVVSAGGDVNSSNNSASDITTIGPAGPDLTITKSHAGNFTAGTERRDLYASLWATREVQRQPALSRSPTPCRVA